MLYATVCWTHCMYLYILGSLFVQPGAAGRTIKFYKGLKMYNNLFRDLDYVNYAMAKNNKFASRQYWAQPDNYDFIDQLVILWN